MNIISRMMIRMMGLAGILVVTRMIKMRTVTIMGKIGHPQHLPNSIMQLLLMIMMLFKIVLVVFMRMTIVNQVGQTQMFQLLQIVILSAKTLLLLNKLHNNRVPLLIIQGKRKIMKGQRRKLSHLVFKVIHLILINILKKLSQHLL